MNHHPYISHLGNKLLILLVSTNNGHSLSAKGADHSNFIAAATTHLESGDQTYNQVVFQVHSKIRIFPIVIDSGDSVSVSPCDMNESNLQMTLNFQA